MMRQPRYEAPGTLMHWGGVVVGLGLATSIGDNPLWALLGWLYLFSFPFRFLIGG